MKQVLLVGCGGALGSIARYLIGGAVLHRFSNLKFPLGTFTVNILGCLLIGIFAGLAEKRGLLGPDARVFLLTGICGGFTPIPRTRLYSCGNTFTKRGSMLAQLSSTQRARGLSVYSAWRVMSVWSA